MAPRLLLIETSGRVGQVALADGESLCALRRLDEARRHARDLAPAVAELLTGQNWTPSDIAAVVVSRGPGSYTGLRVGLMSAMTFAYATGCALLAIDTFAAIAHQAPEEILCIDVVADAQQSKVYRQRFTRTAPGAAPQPDGPLSIESAAGWIATLTHPVGVSGPGLRLHGSLLPREVVTVDEVLWNPQAASLLCLGLARYRLGERDDPFAVEPLYLRPSAAEEKWQTHGPT